MTSRRAAVLVVALAPFVLGAGVGAATGPDQAPPPPPGPVVEFARVEPAKPVVGRRVSFVIRVRDPAFPIRGVRINTGDRGGRLGGTACRIESAALDGPFKPGTTVTIRVRFRFRASGPRKVAFIVTSGDCTGAGLRLGGEVSVAVTPRPPRTPAPVPVPVAAQALCSHADTPTLQTDAAALRSATMCLVNGERRRRSAPQLRGSRKLARAADSHTQDMVRRRFFDHEGPNGPSLTQRLGRVRYKGSAGENIGYETGPDVTARSIVRGWLESPPHRANMLRRKYRGVGVGVSKRAPEGASEPGGTFTADFGTNR